jgi:prepilin-type N-terminal cleavage/methylation domain-containing protein
MTHHGGFETRKETSTVQPPTLALSLRSGTAGFTLIELVMVFAIIAVLAMMTLPNVMKLSRKSRRAEAYQALHSISIAQTAYFTLDGFYAPTFDQLGFQLNGGQRVDASTIQGPYYTYTITTAAVNGVQNQNYRVTATGDIDPSDPVLDIVIIENQLTVVGR